VRVTCHLSATIGRLACARSLAPRPGTHTLAAMRHNPEGTPAGSTLPTGHPVHAPPSLVVPRCSVHPALPRPPPPAPAVSSDRRQQRNAGSGSWVSRSTNEHPAVNGAACGPVRVLALGCGVGAAGMWSARGCAGDRNSAARCTAVPPTSAMEGGGGGRGENDTPALTAASLLVGRAHRIAAGRDLARDVVVAPSGRRLLLRRHQRVSAPSRAPPRRDRRVDFQRGRPAPRGTSRGGGPVESARVTGRWRFGRAWLWRCGPPKV
jgi:hypothetical protein